MRISDWSSDVCSSDLRVVIETTGLADPAPILQAFMTEPQITDHFELDGVIATVDAMAGEETLDRHIEAVKQAAVCDRILLTKTDLDESGRCRALEGRDRKSTRLNSSH